ncbi:MAG TPA: OprD family outer membrane porin, partial [Pseudomonas sp.]
MATTVMRSIAIPRPGAARQRRTPGPLSLAGACVRAASLLGVLCPLAAHADFVDDSQLNLGLRNFYLDRDFRGDAAPISRVGSWSQ